MGFPMFVDTASIFPGYHHVNRRDPPARSATAWVFCITLHNQKTGQVHKCCIDLRGSMVFLVVFAERQLAALVQERCTLPE